MFNITKEYAIEKLSLKEKVNSDALKWYRLMHLARMDNVSFEKMKPPKNIEETFK